MNLREKHLVVIDHGHYQFIADEMVKSYGKVSLYLPQEDAYLHPNKDTIGKGVPGISVVEDDIDFWRDLVFGNKGDVFAFFDVGFGALQWTLQKLGKRVCGSLLSQKVEMDRWHLNEKVKSVGLPTVPMKKIIGTTNLKAFLKKNPQQVVKISYYRGIIETFLADDPFEMELQIVELEHNLGMNKDDLEFICQDIIESELEIGYDGFNVGGFYPPNSLYGPEIKDKAYIGMAVEKMPPLIEFVNKKMAPVIAKDGYQGFYHNELRVTDEPYSKLFRGRPYYTDATCRAGSPPSEAMCKIYEPHCLARAIWDMSEGRVPVLKPLKKWVAEVVLMSPKADKSWLHVNVDKKVKDWVCLKDYCMKNGEIFVIPNNNGGFFGNVVALGDKPQEAINEVLKRAALVKASELEVRMDVFDGAMKQLKLMKSYGLL